MFKNSSEKKITLRKLASFIDSFVAGFPAVPLGPFFFIEIWKNKK